MHWAEGLQDNENCRGSGQLSGKFCSSRLSKWGYSLSISDDLLLHPRRTFLSMHEGTKCV